MASSPLPRVMMTPYRAALRSLVAALAVVSVTACGSDSTEPDPVSGIDLGGSWLLTPGPGAQYTTPSTIVVEFGVTGSGHAELRYESTVNGIATCWVTVFGFLETNVLLFDDEFWVVDVESDDRLVLNDGNSTVSLDRITGAVPVGPCEEAEVTEIAELDYDGIRSDANLNAVGATLYFTVEGGTDSIVGYDTTGDSIVTARGYTASTEGGIHRYVVGARSDSLFYGHCACGFGTSVDFFDLDANASIASTDLDDDLGINVRVTFGFFADSVIVVGGRRWDDSAVTEVISLDPDALTLVSQRQVLEGAGLQDITMLDGDLVALLGNVLVVIAPDGTAERSISLPSGTYFFGMAAVGSTLYLLGDAGPDVYALYEVELP